MIRMERSAAARSETGAVYVTITGWPTPTVLPADGWTSATVMPGVGVGTAAEAVAAGIADAIIVTPSMARTWLSARRKCPSLRSSATTDPSRRAANAHDIGSVAGAQAVVTAQGYSPRLVSHPSMRSATARQPDSSIML